MNTTSKLSEDQAEKNRVRARLWYANNKERAKSNVKRWQKDNSEKVRVSKRKYREGNLEKVREANRGQHGRKYSLKSLYGLTLSDFDRMVEEQNGLCAICETNAPGGKGAWHVDHDHASGLIRGLLCHSCNLMLGHARDNTAFLSSAISYLEKSHGQEETS